MDAMPPPIERQPLSYYRRLITSQYQLAPKFLAWLTAALTAALTPLDDATTCYATLRAGFDLDTALGAQLDTLGATVGAARRLPYQPEDGLDPVLDDATYRIFIKARIAQNHWNGTITSLQEIWTSLFPGGSIVLTDSQNMTATVLLSGVFTALVKSLIVNGYIVPRPEGVLYNFVFSELPILGFDSDDAYIAGFDKGKFA